MWIQFVQLQPITSFRSPTQRSQKVQGVLIPVGQARGNWFMKRLNSLLAARLTLLPLLRFNLPHPPELLLWRKAKIAPNQLGMWLSRREGVWGQMEMVALYWLILLTELTVDRANLKVLTSWQHFTSKTRQNFKLFEKGTLMSTSVFGKPCLHSCITLSHFDYFY